MEKILVLDDDPDRHRSFDRQYPGQVTHVYKIEDFKDLVRNQKWDMISLDHDLDASSINNRLDYAKYVSIFGNHYDKTGMDAVDILVDPANKVSRDTKMVVHTWNSGVWGLMVKKLKDAGFSNTIRWPYARHN